jgi:hypothetical protein
MKNKYNEPEIKVTDCSGNEDVMTASSIFDLLDGDNYDNN